MPDDSGNPLRQGLPRERTPEQATVVIFGITGDLANRKLIPALYSLHRQRFLPENAAIVGLSRRDMGDSGLREQVRKSVAAARGGQPPENEWQGFDELFHYVCGEFGDRALFDRLKERLDQLQGRRGGAPARNRLYYLSTPPDAFGPILSGLSQSSLVHAHTGSSPWARVIVEKPFGYDLESARKLNDLIGSAFSEPQIFRIDHYLGKETVQNILVLRFANGVFEPLWNQKYIDHVQITVAEALGVEGRAGYFEHAGILRDILQNHMMQVLSLVAMEPPVAMGGEAIRDEKVKVLRSLRPIEVRRVDEEVVRGQYGPGSIGGDPVPGYREEPGVAKDSVTETFTAMRVFVDNWRWAGVPFYLRTGKRLPRRATEVAIQFNGAPLRLFPQASTEDLSANVLALRIQPDEGISIRFGAKVPGPSLRVQPVKMDFLYGASFGVEPPEAYERLLLDCLLGDSTLFIRRDEVEMAWSFVQSVMDGWAEKRPADFPNYAAGSWGPPAADALISRDGRQWRRL